MSSGKKKKCYLHRKDKPELRLGQRFQGLKEARFIPQHCGLMSKRKNNKYREI